MSMQARDRSLKRELFEQYEELLFRIAVLEINEEDAAFYEQDRSSETEMEDFFNHTKAKTLRMIHGVARKAKTLRILRIELPRVARIAAMLLLIVYIGATAAIAAVPEIRIHVANFLIRTSEEYTSLNLAEDPGLSSFVPDEWGGEYFPTYIPADFEMRPIGPKRTRVYYLNPSGDLLDFTEYTKDTYVNIDTENAELQDIVLNGKPALLAVKGDRVTVAWSEADRYFILIFEGDVDTAMRIVTSVKNIR